MGKAADRYFKPLKRERVSEFTKPFICICGREYKRYKAYTAHRRKFNCQEAIDFNPSLNWLGQQNIRP